MNRMKEKWFDVGLLSGLSVLAKGVWLELWTIAERSGYVEGSSDNPIRLDSGAEWLESGLAELAARGLITVSDSGIVVQIVEQVSRVSKIRRLAGQKGLASRWKKAVNNPEENQKPDSKPDSKMDSKTDSKMDSKMDGCQKSAELTQVPDSPELPARQKNNGRIANRIAKPIANRIAKPIAKLTAVKNPEINQEMPQVSEPPALTAAERVEEGAGLIAKSGQNSGNGESCLVNHNFNFGLERNCVKPLVKIQTNNTLPNRNGSNIKLKESIQEGGDCKGGKPTSRSAPGLIAKSEVDCHAFLPLDGVEELACPERVSKNGLARGQLKEAKAKLEEAWNSQPELPKIVKWTPTRERALRARLLEDAGWLELALKVIPLIPKCPFLCGRNDSGWRATIDWVLRPNSVTRLLEGQFSANKRVVGSGGSITEMARRAAEKVKAKKATSTSLSTAKEEKR